MAELLPQRSGGAVTHLQLPENGVSYLVGDGSVEANPRAPFSELVCDFLNELSDLLKKNSGDFTDIATFAFWCRRRHLDELKGNRTQELRLGKGMVFHIAPENVPINFAYTLALGLLAGNTNVVRVPSKAFEQVDIVCDALNKLLQVAKFSELTTQITVIRYERNDEITAQLSALCDARVIWGGDDTVQHIRQLPIPARASEITFADRYSISALSTKALKALPEKDLTRLAERFFNDTYFMDQNACSSPHIVFWIGEQDSSAIERFWSALKDSVRKKYVMEPAKAVAKYADFCQAAIDHPGVAKTGSEDNLLYRLTIEELPEDVANLRGRFGMFYEYGLSELSELGNIITSRFQTLTYFGFEEDALNQFVGSKNLAGIDRIVPIGRALEMDVFWDGYDVISSLSRLVKVA